MKLHFQTFASHYVHNVLLFEYCMPQSRLRPQAPVNTLITPVYRPLNTVIAQQWLTECLYSSFCVCVAVCNHWRLKKTNIHFQSV